MIIFKKYLSFKFENYESENTYLISFFIIICWEGVFSCQSYFFFDNVRLFKYTGFFECDWKEDFIELGNNYSDCFYSGYNGFLCYSVFKNFI